MLGPLGWQETIFIFLLALLLFGPKKLPELGKTVGKALTEFRRASSELKATWDREMSSLERESESLKEVTQDLDLSSLSCDTLGPDPYDSSYYDAGQTYPSYDSTATEPSPVGASATQGAEVEPGPAPEPAPEETASAEPPVEQPVEAAEESGEHQPRAAEA
ncbi:MAG: twin-arginine translocase TatA/TatE family subunit [bacterium]|jgi:sec-independent protein translocase protein TatA